MRREGLVKSGPMFRLALVAIVIAAAAACSKKDGKAGRQAPAVPVVVASVEQKSLPVLIRAAGVVEAAASVSVVSRVDGPIVRVFVQDGQDVKAGQPLVQIDPQPLSIKVRQAEANLAKNTALLSDARSKEARGRALLDQHFISNEEYLQLKANLDSADASVKSDGAALDEAKLQLDYATVRAPVSGKIGHVALQVGNVVRAASPELLTTLNVLDTVDVSFAVPEQNLPAVRQALQAKTATVAVPLAAGSAAGPELKGRLSFVDNAVDRTSGTIRLRARFENRGHALWPGQFVTVNLALGTDAAAIVIPAVAIAQGPDGPYVFVVGRDMAVQQRRVEVVRSAGEDSLVSGVNAGERIVVDGQSRLAPGAKVSIRGAPDAQPARAATPAP